MELNDKIINLIKDNMNETQKGLLGDFFKDYDLMKNQLKETKLSLEKTTESLKHYQSEFEKLNKIKSNLDSLIKDYSGKLESLQKDRIEFDLKMAQKEIEFMKNNFGEVRQLVETVFKNRQFVHKENYHEHISGHNSPQGWVQDRHLNKNYSSTTIEE